MKTLKHFLLLLFSLDCFLTLCEILSPVNSDFINNICICTYNVAIKGIDAATYLLTYIHTYLLAYLHTYLLTFLLTYLLQGELVEDASVETAEEAAALLISLLEVSTVCPRSLGPFYVASCYRKLVKTSWT